MKKQPEGVISTVKHRKNGKMVVTIMPKYVPEFIKYYGMFLNSLLEKKG